MVAQIVQNARSQRSTPSLPSHPKAILGVIGFLLLSVFLVGFSLRSTVDNRSRANSLVSQPIITQLAPDQVTLNFTTQEQLFSKIKIAADYVVQPRVLPIATAPTTVHQITIHDLRPDTNYQYQIILFDEKGERATSAKFTFKTSPS